MPESIPGVAIQLDFLYFECPECEYDCVVKNNFAGTILCALCLSDSGHRTLMVGRYARSTDDPEGPDARIPPSMREKESPSNID